MPGSKSVKKAVRERDGQRCSECGMTAGEHRRRFGQTLHVHRTEFGPYKAESCVAVCQLCHQARHSFKCAVRKRDGYACTECGLTDEEHHRLYDRPLSVHCPRTQRCDEWEWRSLGVKEAECHTLCHFCHLAKHSIRPAVLRRDGFACVRCGKKPEDDRRWFEAVTVHRLEGYCDEEVGAEADPAGFVTLCRGCHGPLHADPFADLLRAGGVLVLPDVLREHGRKLGVDGPVTSKEQLAGYRQYLLLVNFYIRHFRLNGVPRRSQIGPSVTRLAPTTLSAALRREAARQAVHELSCQVGLTRREEKELGRMNEGERARSLREREDRRIESVIDLNNEPQLPIQIGGHWRFVPI